MKKMIIDDDKNDDYHEEEDDSDKDDVQEEDDNIYNDANIGDNENVNGDYYQYLLFLMSLLFKLIVTWFYISNTALIYFLKHNKDFGH